MQAKFPEKKFMETKTAKKILEQGELTVKV